MYVWMYICMYVCACIFLLYIPTTISFWLTSLHLGWAQLSSSLIVFRLHYALIGNAAFNVALVSALFMIFVALAALRCRFHLLNFMASASFLHNFADSSQRSKFNILFSFFSFAILFLFLYFGSVAICLCFSVAFLVLTTGKRHISTHNKLIVFVVVGAFRSLRWQSI